jgi:lipopolysaccharide transport system ATP-binding protein
MDAIVIRNVVKNFKKSTIRREYTTLKSELVRWLTGKREKAPKMFIEALRGVDLAVPQGKTVGIIGRNGSGKSTLLKLMTGIYAPTSGTIEMNGRVSALLDLGAGFHPDFSGRENILINGIILGMTRAAIRARMDEIIEFSELGEFIDEPVRTYSSGMYMRLAFAVATHVDPDILIVDEILAVGDEHFSKKSMGKMMQFKEQGKTIVLVTHDLGTVEKWCDLAAWVDAGRVRRVGPPAEVVQEYRRAVALAEKQERVMVPAAIAADGGALPAVEAEAGPGGAEAEVKLTEVRLKGKAGEAVSQVDTEEGFSLEVEYQSRKPVEEVDFTVCVKRADGVVVYQTSTVAEGLSLPKPMGPQGRVVLVVERVGWTAGEYCFEVAVKAKDGRVHEERKEACRLKVSSALRDGGVARPVHRWRVESEGSAHLELLPRSVGS